MRLGNFGGPTAKPTHLYTNAKWLAALNASPLCEQVPPQDHQLVRKYVDKTGRARVSGTKLLKRSQSDT